MDDKAFKNTDKEIWKQSINYVIDDGNDRGMEPSVFVTKQGRVGFNYYGTCVVKTIKEWVNDTRSNTDIKEKDEEEIVWPFGPDRFKETDVKPNLNIKASKNELIQEGIGDIHPLFFLPLFVMICILILGTIFLINGG